MMKTIQSIESSLGNLGRLLYRRRMVTVVVVLLVTGVMAGQLRHLAFDPSTEAFFDQDDPALVQYNAFKEQFGQDDLAIITIQPKDVFDAPFLTRLKAFHTALEKEVPYLDEVTSLINARDTRGVGNRLEVGELLEKFPANAKEMAALKKRVLANPLYRNLLISEDGKFTTLVVKKQLHGVEPAKETASLSEFEDMGQTAPRQEDSTVAANKVKELQDDKFNRAVSAVARRFEGPDFPIHVAGTIAVTHYLKAEMQSNMRRFTLLAILTIAIFLFVLFRRVSAVLFALITVVLSLVLTVSVMAMLGVSLKMSSMILPSFLLAVGVGNSVHILTIFFRRLDQKGDQEEAIGYAMGHSALPVFMTNLTTAAGLFSFLTANLAMVAELGLFAGVGVMLAFVITLILLPALLGFVRYKPRPIGTGDTQPLLDRWLIKIGDHATANPLKVAAVWGVVVGVSLIGATQLRFSHNPVKWLAETSDVRQATELIDREMKGSVSMSVLVDTGRENGLHNPQVLNAMETFEREVETLPDQGGQGKMVGKTLGLNDMLKEINQALNENRSEFYTIPQNKQLIAQEFLLFENSGSDDLEDVVDSRFSKTQITLRTPWRDASTYVDFVNHVQQRGDELFKGQATVIPTGMLVLFTQAIHGVMISMTNSYLVAAVIITLLMMLVVGNIRIGLLSMVPNLAPILITLGIMGWMDIPLDLFNMMIGSIAIGLAVDDTIHFLHNFRRYYHQTHDAKQAVHMTLATAGRAMLFTSLVLVTGFFIYTFSSMNNLFYFGWLTGITLAIALLADIQLSPALMTLVTAKKGKLAEKWADDAPDDNQGET
ncbi:MAG: efflux RND transporter permease subunit [Deltaproteobacteria bacterium]|nr:efflux RND transporter permease subunit [Deltaproteobacteria bacterium]